MNNLEKAKQLLSENTYTCVICSDSDTLTSRERGVSPLMKWLNEGKVLDEYSAADKVVGNGAAFLYILLKIKELHAEVISRPALDNLKAHGIPVTFSTLAEAIRNRDSTGFCPIETAVSGITEPAAALEAIKNRLAEMKVN